MRNENIQHLHKPTAVVAGASGFIGQALGPALAKRFRVVGISRSTRQAANGYSEFRQVDLFYRPRLEAALEGADVAVYLVHSMMPSARLVQGHFSNLDLLCADNFARAAKKAGVKHIVYVGGLLPKAKHLSKHMESRLEVEGALASTGVPVTTLRAGMVIGAGGSSYEMLLRLVKRIPVMLCPSWTRTKMQPVALQDVVRAVDYVIDGRPLGRRVYDLGAPQQVTYQQLMAKVANSLGVVRRMIPVPLLSPRLSRLWVSLTTGAPKALAAPLVESLVHDMVARDKGRYQLPGLNPIDIDEMLVAAASHEDIDRAEPKAFQPSRDVKHNFKVCSVQRMCLPAGRDSVWAAEEYLRWLTRENRGIVRVRPASEPGQTEIVFAPTGHALLSFRSVASQSSPDCQVLHVTGGLLAKAGNGGRLEFRQILGGRTLLVTVYDFEPRLPWWLYRCTQGQLHRLVMRQFSSYLAKGGMLSDLQV